MNKNTDVKVKVTDEYGLFSLVTGNRAVNPAHTKELRKSIEKVGLIPAPKPRTDLCIASRKSSENTYSRST